SFSDRYGGEHPGLLPNGTRHIGHPMRVWPARHVHACCEENVTLEMHATQVAARADIDVRTDSRGPLAEDRAEVCSRRSIEMVENRGQEGAAQIDPDEPGNQRERLCGALERAVVAHHRPSEVERK